MVEGGHTGVWGHPPVLFQIYTHGQWLWQVSLYLTMQCGISISKSGVSDQILFHTRINRMRYSSKKKEEMVLSTESKHVIAMNKENISIRYSDPLPFLLEMHA